MKICPDFDKYPELSRVYNNYNSPDRDDLSMVIMKCDNRDQPED